MSDKHNQMIIRARDMGYAVLLFTIFGYLLGPAKKVFQMNEVIEKFRNIESVVNEHSRNIAVISSQMDEIKANQEKAISMLYQISKEVRR